MEAFPSHTGSIAEGMVVLRDQSGKDILSQWRGYFSEMTLRPMIPAMINPAETNRQALAESP